MFCLRRLRFCRAMMLSRALLPIWFQRRKLSSTLDLDSFLFVHIRLQRRCRQAKAVPKVRPTLKSHGIRASAGYGDSVEDNSSSSPNPGKKFGPLSKKDHDIVTRAHVERWLSEIALENMTPAQLASLPLPVVRDKTNFGFFTHSFFIPCSFQRIHWPC